MFNGKVQFQGKIIEAVTISESIVQVSIATDNLDYKSLKKGDIMLHNGCSLTISEIADSYYQVLIYKETLSCTTGLTQVGNIINIEPALKIGDPLNGNMVTGFIDGVAIVDNINPIGECRIITFELMPELSKYLVNKSAIVINGVSLTINHVHLNKFEVNLGPRTISSTILGRLSTGTTVNIEINQLAKYVYQFINNMGLKTS